MRKTFITLNIYRNQIVKALPWLVILIMPGIYWLLNKQFTGPVILSDEIGYLAKASFLAGHSIDGSSSYYPGFSILLAPLFIFLSNTTQIWNSVLLVNTLLWVLSFFLLWRLLGTLAPNVTSINRTMALLVASLYPTFASLSGYAYTSSLLALLFLCSLSALINWKPGEVINILPFSLSVGLYYWVHPTGLAIILASILVITFSCVRIKKWLPILLHLAIVLSMVISCNILIDWMNASMTPIGNLVITHYPSIKTFLATIITIRFWVDFFGLLLGQSTYLIISSFGLIAFVFYTYTPILVENFSHRRKDSSQDFSISISYLLLSLIGILAMGSLSFATSTYHRIDHVIYGRYTESLIPSFVAIGYLSWFTLPKFSRIKFTYFNLLFVLSSALIIQYFLSVQNLKVSSANAIVTTSAFWPQFLTNFSSYLLWFGIGGLGILIVALGGKYIALLFMVLSFVISFSGQAKWHKGVLDSYSNPSSFVDIIRSNFVPGTCVGFDNQSTKTDSQYKNERFNLYQFYLYDFNYQRMTPEEWFSNCNGPYLSYSVPQFVDKEQAKLIARENASGLFLIMKNQDSELIVTDNVIKENDLSLSLDFGPNCIVSGCFFMRATQLTKWTQVGTLQGNSLLTSNQNGFLFYGPYTQLAKGNYFLVLNGKFNKGSGATLDVTSDGAQVVHLVAKLSDFKIEASSPLVIPLEIPEDVQNLEVRLRVSELDTMSISDYEIILQQETRLLPTKYR